MQVVLAAMVLALAMGLSATAAAQSGQQLAPHDKAGAGRASALAAPVTAAPRQTRASAMRAATATQPFAINGQAMGKRLTINDKLWLKGAHQFNLAEIRTGRFAQHHASSKAVRRAGRTLARHHRVMDAKLTAVAQQLGVTLPGKLTTRRQTMIEATEAKQGMAFDKSWLHMQILTHLQALAKTRREIVNGESPQLVPKVVKLAKRTLPKLKKHLHLLKRTGQELRRNE